MTKHQSIFLDALKKLDVEGLWSRKGSHLQPELNFLNYRVINRAFTFYTTVFNGFSAQLAEAVEYTDSIFAEG